MTCQFCQQGTRLEDATTGSAYCGYCGATWGIAPRVERGNGPTAAQAPARGRKSDGSGFTRIGKAGKPLKAYKDVADGKQREWTR